MLLFCVNFGGVISLRMRDCVSTGVEMLEVAADADLGVCAEECGESLGEAVIRHINPYSFQRFWSISRDWSCRPFDARSEVATDEGEGGDICGVGLRKLRETRIGRKMTENTTNRRFQRIVNRCSI
jgi:hypothetical protein